jgi:glycosyltransferase involved in cell wall biosynthesis
MRRRSVTSAINPCLSPPLPARPPRSLGRWVRSYLHNEPMALPPEHDGPGINLIGPASFEFSLSVTLRHIAAALEARGVPFRIHDLGHGRTRHGPDTSWKRHGVDSISELPHDIKLFCINIMQLPALLQRLSEDTIRWTDRLNVAVVFWELPVVPPHLAAALAAFDVLLCGSWFVREAVGAHVPHAIALNFRYPLVLPERARMSRAEYGLDAQDFAFYFAFDPLSGIDRKNPSGVVKAFQKAFGADERVRLVLKANAPQGSEAAWTAAARALLAECARDPRITVIAHQGTYGEAVAICEACCDCYVSLHRSEGLGMGPAEAMLLGKPVIVTAWSGTMSYATADAACLVPTHLTRPDGWDSNQFDPPYVGQRVDWAEPDLGVAAYWMVRIHRDGEFRRTVAANGMRRVQAMVDEALGCGFVDELGALRDLKKTGSGRVRRLDEVQAALRHAEGRSTRLRTLRAKRWLANRVPGMYRLLRAMDAR